MAGRRWCIPAKSSANPEGSLAQANVAACQIVSILCGYPQTGENRQEVPGQSCQPVGQHIADVQNQEWARCAMLARHCMPLDTNISAHPGASSGRKGWISTCSKRPPHRNIATDDRHVRYLRHIDARICYTHAHAHALAPALAFVSAVWSVGICVCTQVCARSNEWVSERVSG